MVSVKIGMDEFSSKTVCVTPQNWKKLNRYPWFLMDEFSSKTACVTPQNWNFEKKLDEFSSKTACVTTQKMEILGKFLDEFSMICQ